MTSNKKPFRIEDIAAELGDAPFGSSLKNDDYITFGALVIQGKNIQGRSCDWTDRRYVSHQKYESLQRSHCFPGDLIFPKVGTIGKIGILTPCEGVDYYLLSTNVMRLRPNESVACRDYVYYFFNSLKTRNFIRAINSKSVQPVFNYTSLKNFIIELPSLNYQQAVARILTSLDDKIELNRQINETLEAMARAIFKSWFVDFDPVRAKAEGRDTGLPPEIAALFPAEIVEVGGREVPKGWGVALLPEVFEINPKRSLAKDQIAPYLDMQNVPTIGHRPIDWIMRAFGSGTKFLNGDTLLARITPCLENGKTIFVDFLDEGQIGWGSTEYIVLRPKPPLPTEFGYLLARDEDFRAHAILNMSGSSGRQRVPSECFDSYQIVVPSKDIARQFGELVKPLMVKIKANDEQSRTLTQIRDVLLPKLMSGEIQVETLENSA